MYFVSVLRLVDNMTDRIVQMLDRQQKQGDQKARAHLR